MDYNNMVRKILIAFVIICNCHLPIQASQVSTDCSSKHKIFQLMLAAESGNIERIQSLFEQGISIDARDEKGWNALDWAIYASQLNTALYLMNHGLTPMKVYPLMQYALRQNKLKIAEFLIQHFNGMRYILAGFIPQSIYLYDIDPLFKIAIQAGFDINKQNDKGNTILMEIATISAFMIDSRVFSKDVLNSHIAMLLRLGANKSIKNNKGETALSLAQSKSSGFLSSNKEILELLK